MDDTYKYYIRESNDGARVCKLKFVDDGSEYQHHSRKTLLTVAREEADNPTPENNQPLVKGPFTINEIKPEVDALQYDGLILDEHHAANVLMFTQQQAVVEKEEENQQRKNLNEINLEGEDKKYSNEYVKFKIFI